MRRLHRLYIYGFQTIVVILILYFRSKLKIHIILYTLLALTVIYYSYKLITIITGKVFFKKDLMRMRSIFEKRITKQKKRLY